MGRNAPKEPTPELRTRRKTTVSVHLGREPNLYETFTAAYNVAAAEMEANSGGTRFLLKGEFARFVMACGLLNLPKKP